MVSKGCQPVGGCLTSCIRNFRTLELVFLTWTMTTNKTRLPHSRVNCHLGWATIKHQQSQYWECRRSQKRKSALATMETRATILIHLSHQAAMKIGSWSLSLPMKRLWWMHKVWQQRAAVLIKDKQLIKLQTLQIERDSHLSKCSPPKTSKKTKATPTVKIWLWARRDDLEIAEQQQTPLVTCVAKHQTDRSFVCKPFFL